MKPPLDRWERSPRLICGAAVLVYGVTGYFILNKLPFQSHHLVPRIHPLDDAPILPWTVILYISLYPFVGLALWLLPDVRSAKRYLAAMLVSVSAAYTFFALWPTRIERAAAPEGATWRWALDLLRTIDDPHNCFPSLHATHLVLGLWIAWPTRWRFAAVLWALVIAASTLTTDQHYFLDLPSGAALGLLGIATSRWLAYKFANRHE